MYIYIYVNSDNTISAVSGAQLSLDYFSTGTREERVDEDELKGKLPDGATIQSLAAFGFQFIKDGLSFNLVNVDEPIDLTKETLEEATARINNQVQIILESARQTLANQNDRTQEAFAAFDIELAKKIVAGTATDEEKKLYEHELKETKDNPTDADILALANSKIAKVNSIMKPMCQCSGIERSIRKKIAEADTVEKLETAFDEISDRLDEIIQETYPPQQP